MRAFLGMGLLGSNFTKALINKGEQVQVWNRTTSRATALEAFGAKAFTNVADAVKGADYVHIVVKDDAAVNEVLAAAAPGFKPGTVIIDHTTTTVEGAVARTKEWKDKGFTYLHAPVFMGPGNALDSSGYMLVSGDQAVVNKLEPVLAPMTGKLLNFGEETGKAAAMKLVGNSFLICLTAGLTDMLSVGKALGVNGDDILTLLADWNPGMGVTSRLKRILSAPYDDPSWELNMARKDAGIFIDSTAKAGTNLNVIPVVAQVMDEWIAKGFGNKDWTVISKDVV
ncbi:NAD(P)-dependent oxidoreductase [Chitinophaga sancti]|uniref:3-hydroxyisobutyrate dehydrogenase n=1 Tax=Chitinophaga sancti TaxID=1004 RepID=A0A1K1S277_9BACT|nr:NAD(P)-dependent oxidoreductase [Chitinophaga sancti]WQD59708.1 NAD(P)-dependent oxidoreductase [Chitinophaga sancti]WQG88161.1 NAD(P)-dependent oxidoreductase [Chitinophaga sancti]SFW78165.1 3-hydroxyisobutyrate dehydrogenase [Chitinophaga sancti]